MRDTYQGQNEGYRGVVTRASVLAIKRSGNICPGCGDQVPKGSEQNHALDCLELRDDITRKV
jgi:hypothetical protein